MYVFYSLIAFHIQQKVTEDATRKKKNSSLQLKYISYLNVSSSECTASYITSYSDKKWLLSSPIFHLALLLSSSRKERVVSTTSVFTETPTAPTAWSLTYQSDLHILLLPVEQDMVKNVLT